MRATVFLFDCRSSLAATLAHAEGRELELSCADGLTEGDWLMVKVSVGQDATCLAARVVNRDGRDDQVRWGVEFAEHDWERLLAFATPEATAPSVKAPSQTPACSVCPPGGTNILIVHDDPTVAALLGSMLGSHGFCATQAASPREAFETLATGEVDLVLADWMTHGMAGQEFCAELDSQCLSRAARRPALVFLACPSARADRAVALEAGADDFVVLPFRWRELDARLLSLLHRVGAN